MERDKRYPFLAVLLEFSCMAYIYQELMKHLKEVADSDAEEAVAKVEVVEVIVEETILEGETTQNITNLSVPNRSNHLTSSVRPAGRKGTGQQLAQLKLSPSRNLLLRTTYSSPQ